MPGPAAVEGEFRGYIVDAWVSRRSGQARLCGRLDDGRSFAASLPFKPTCYVLSRDFDRAGAAIAGSGARVGDCYFRSMEGEPCLAVESPSLRAESLLVRALGSAGVEASCADLRPEDRFLAALGIGREIVIRGVPRPGRRVDAAFASPALSPRDEGGPGSHKAYTLRSLSMDIETERSGRVLEMAMALRDGEGPIRGRLLSLGGSRRSGSEGDYLLEEYPDEVGLLSAFAAFLVKDDPDIVTGWNVVDFDLSVLAGRFEALGLALDLSRANDEACAILQATTGRLAFADIPGRQVVDGMRLARAGPRRYEDYALDTVARAELGKGKEVGERGEDKLAALESLRARDPAAFRAYCWSDAVLVHGILEKTGLLGLTMSRSLLTGVGMDAAWTSVRSFERVYLTGLLSRGVLPPPGPGRGAVYGSPGGTIIEPRPGISPNVLVLDFKSLYPTVIATYNVDPMARARALAEPGLPAIEAPNGARFALPEGPLPAVIRRYFAEREEARSRGDETATYVYKILMNSFYGVLGADSCRYAHRDMAGAITSFGKRHLLAAKAVVESRGHAVLYGDTDSLFVLSGLPDSAGYEAFAALGKTLAEAIGEDANRMAAAAGAGRPMLEIKFEKAYRRFFIPRLKAAGRESEGRAKGYAGLSLLPGGGEAVEARGIEAARSDWTALARDFQMAMLDLAFRGADEASMRRFVRSRLAALASGALDGSLVYRKTLRRPASSYERTEPPQVRAARLLGWEGRRGRVDYLMTLSGAEPVQARSSPIDYRHYVEKQLLPASEPILEALGMDAKAVFGLGGQMELGL